MDEARLAELQKEASEGKWENKDSAELIKRLGQLHGMQNLAGIPNSRLSNLIQEIHRILASRENQKNHENLRRDIDLVRSDLASTKGELQSLKSIEQDSASTLYFTRWIFFLTILGCALAAGVPLLIEVLKARHVERTSPTPDTATPRREPTPTNQDTVVPSILSLQTQKLTIPSTQLPKSQLPTTNTSRQLPQTNTAPAPQTNQTKR